MSKSATPCAVCGQPTKSQTGVCRRTAECALEQKRRRYAAEPEAVLERSRRYYQQNSDAVKERVRRYQNANAEAQRERSQRYREANRDVILEQRRGYREVNREAVNEGKRLYYQNNRESVLESHRRWAAENRAKVFAHYSPSTPPRCACCGTTENLTIDHINGGGTAHVKKVTKVGGGRFYRWLIKENFPPGYQVLCRPCNTSKREGQHCQIHPPRVIQRSCSW